MTRPQAVTTSDINIPNPGSNGQVMERGNIVYLLHILADLAGALHITIVGHPGSRRFGIGSADCRLLGEYSQYREIRNEERK